MVINICSKMEVENKMSKREDEASASSYPVRSLHEFLAELDKEWDAFRTAAMIGIAASALVLVFFVYRFFGLLVRIRLGLRFIDIIDELIFLVLAAAFAIYEISLLLRQHRFFSKWERRVGLLLHLEEELMEGKEGRIGGT